MLVVVTLEDDPIRSTAVHDKQYLVSNTYYYSCYDAVCICSFFWVLYLLSTSEMLPLRCSPSSPSALVSMTAQHPVEGLPCTQNMTRRPRAGLSVPYDTLPSLNLKEKNSLSML